MHNDSHMQQPTDRLHALDAVRAGALLLGIVLHAVVSFLPSAEQNGSLLVDSSPSQALSDLYLFIHLFRMPLFFMMAGFFARLSLERKGVWAFAADRVQRIGIPFLLGCILINPIGGWLVEWVAMQEGKQFREPWYPEGTVLLSAMSHLWFLWMLLLLYVAALLLRWLMTRVLDRKGRLLPGLDALVRALFTLPVGAIVLGIPVAVALYTYKYWWVSLGIPTPDYSLVPNTPAVVGFGLAFGVGWLLQRQTDLLDLLARDWVINLPGALLFTAGCVMLAGTDFAATIDEVTARRTFAICYGAAAWYWIFTLVGAAMRFLSRPNVPVRYVADASYWMYLWHVPLVIGMQIAVMHLDWHWSLKLLLILSVTSVVLLGTYQALVRHTVLGHLINGRRKER
jgi:glucan biosynthesis protein C